MEHRRGGDGGRRRGGAEEIRRLVVVVKRLHDDAGRSRDGEGAQPCYAVTGVALGGGCL